MHVELHPSLDGGPVSREMLGGLPPEPAFPEEEYQGRIERVREGMTERGVDVLLVQHPSSVTYLSGYQSFSMNNGETVILPIDDEPSLIVHGPEIGGALLHSWFGRILGYPPGKAYESYVTGLLSDQGFGRAKVGVEMRSQAVTAAANATLTEGLPDADLVDASGLLDTVRLIKSEREIEHLQRAARFTDAGMSAAVEAASEGVTDNDVAAAAYHAMASAGSDYLSHCVVVTSGRRSGILHSTYKRNRIMAGDPILLEMGGCWQRYTSPLMRAVSIGEPSPEVRRAADACLNALDNVLSTIRPGVTAHEVAQAGWQALNEAGPGLVSHGNFGYGVGLGFPPTWADWTGRIELGVETVLRPSMVFHHPVALRKLGEFGVAVSETSVVTDEGPRVFGTVERQLFVK